MTDYLTTQQVADELRVSNRTVARWVREGLLTPDVVAPGGRGVFLFTPDTIAAWKAHQL
jgi:excisionase family DNA binding protein